MGASQSIISPATKTPGTRWSIRFRSSSGHEIPPAEEIASAHESLSYEEKLAESRRLADNYFQSQRYGEFVATKLPHLDEILVDWVESPGFDELLVDTVTGTFPAHEHEQFVAHYRGLLGSWARDQRAVA